MRRPSRRSTPVRARYAASLAALMCAWLLRPGRAAALDTQTPENGAAPGYGTTFIDHSRTLPWWFSAEANSIAQFKFPFMERYSGPNSLRADSEAGKMGMSDLFDINPAGSDSHLRFMNWTVDNNGAWDYAADTRGYTYAAVLEYQGPLFEVRFAEALLPRVANGLEVEWNLAKSHAENLEVEIKYSRRDRWLGTVRVLGFANRADMGSYDEANAAFRAGIDKTPDITAHRHIGNSKYGLGVNVIQELGGSVRLFSRGRLERRSQRVVGLHRGRRHVRNRRRSARDPLVPALRQDRPGAGDQRAVAAAPRVPAAGRTRVPAGRPQPALRPREDRRAVL